MVDVIGDYRRFNRRHVIEIADRDYTPLGRLRRWDSLETVERYCDIGEGKVDCTPTGWNRELVAAGRNVIVREFGRVVSAGPLEFGEDQGDSLRMTVDWKDDIVRLNERLAYVDPSRHPVGKLSRASDDRRGPTTTVIMGYVNDNIGPGALMDRRVPGLVMGTDIRGGAYLNAAVQARFDNLLVLVRQLATTGGVRFSMSLAGRGLVFACTEVEDLSDRVSFSLRVRRRPTAGNLRTAAYRFKAPTATRIVAGGAGEDAERVFLIAQSAESLADEQLWRRVEYFRDDRSAEGDSLAANALRDLAEKGSTLSAEFTTADRNLLQGRDYPLGSFVSCVLRPGLTVVKPILEVRRTVSVSGGVQIVPTAGDYGANNATAAQHQISQIRETVNALKRNR